MTTRRSSYRKNRNGEWTEITSFSGELLQFFIAPPTVEETLSTLGTLSRKSLRNNSFQGFKEPRIPSPFLESHECRSIPRQRIWRKTPCGRWGGSARWARHISRTSARTAPPPRARATDLRLSLVSEDT